MVKLQKQCRINFNGNQKLKWGGEKNVKVRRELIIYFKIVNEFDKVVSSDREKGREN